MPAAVASDIARVRSLQRARQFPALSAEEELATDWTWLLDFTHQGQPLTEKEILFIVAYARNGFQSITDALKEMGKAAQQPKDPAKPDVSCVLSATVQAALAQATRNVVKGWECSLPKVHRTLFNILDSRITDVADVGAAGIALKDFRTVPPEKLDAIQEIVETRNAQGTQLRVRFYDKIASATTLARLLGGFTEKIEISVDVKGFEQRLATAIQRISADKVGEVIEGELLDGPTDTTSSL